MRMDGAPFGVAGIWENWRDPATLQWERTFAIVTVEANALVRAIHDRMPAILENSDFPRWLGLKKTRTTFSCRTALTILRYPRSAANDGRTCKKHGGNRIIFPRRARRTPAEAGTRFRPRAHAGCFAIWCC
jgi:putative SOS response-associated peptidase YedK